MSDKYKKIPKSVKIFGGIAGAKTLYEAFKDPDDIDKAVDAAMTFAPFGGWTTKEDSLKEIAKTAKKINNPNLDDLEKDAVSANLDYAPTKEKLKEATLNENEKHQTKITCIKLGIHGENFYNFNKITLDLEHEKQNYIKNEFSKEKWDNDFPNILQNTASKYKYQINQNLENNNSLKM